ncbi:MAG: hypothetical protein M3066_17260 [Actinomycetota bacterium]|nr:hypothetical protein [Actinomycetota bacterium]
MQGPGVVDDGTIVVEDDGAVVVDPGRVIIVATPGAVVVVISVQIGVVVDVDMGTVVAVVPSSPADVVVVVDADDGSVVVVATTPAGVVIDVDVDVGVVVVVATCGGEVVVVVAETGVVVVVPSTPPETVVVVDPEAGTVVVVAMSGGIVVVDAVGEVVVVLDTVPGVLVVVDPVAGIVVVVARSGVVVVVAPGTVVDVDVGMVVVVGMSAVVVVVVDRGVVLEVDVGIVVVVGRTDTVEVVDKGIVVVDDKAGIVEVAAIWRWFVKLTSVTPAPASTVTLALVRLGAAVIRSAGATMMAATRMSVGTASETVTAVFSGKVPAIAQLPAGTVRAVPPTVKEKGAPRTTPAPAILHTFNWPVSTWLMKLTVVAWVKSPATTCTSAERAARSVPSRRDEGVAVIPVTVTGPRSPSVTVAVPAGTRRSDEQVPTATSAVWPATVKVKVPVTLLESDLLQICRNPIGTASLVKVASVTPGPIPTDTVPSVRLALPTIRSAGTTPMADTCVPGWESSDTDTTEPYG